jgi:hypothetical protein
VLACRRYGSIGTQRARRALTRSRRSCITRSRSETPCAVRSRLLMHSQLHARAIELDRDFVVPATTVSARASDHRTHMYNRSQAHDSLFERTLTTRSSLGVPLER